MIPVGHTQVSRRLEAAHLEALPSCLAHIPAHPRSTDWIGGSGVVVQALGGLGLKLPSSADHIFTV